MEHHDGSLSAMKDPQTALEILSHGKKERAEKVSLCPLCRLTGQKECLFPMVGKFGHCDGYALNPNKTEGDVVELLKT